MARIVLEQRVRRHLAIILPARPIFRGTKQGASEAGAADVGIDVPRLDVAHRTRVAPIGVGPRPDLDEAGHRAVVALGNEYLAVGPTAKLLHSRRQLRRG